MIAPDEWGDSPRTGHRPVVTDEWPGDLWCVAVHVGYGTEYVGPWTNLAEAVEWSRSIPEYPKTQICRPIPPHQLDIW